MTLTQCMHGFIVQRISIMLLFSYSDYEWHVETIQLSVHFIWSDLIILNYFPKKCLIKITEKTKKRENMHAK